MRIDLPEQKRAAAALLVVRIGAVGVCTVLVALPPPAGRNLFVHPWLNAGALTAICAATALVGSGRAARAAGAIAALISACAGCAALVAHDSWFVLPVRDAELTIVFAALSCFAAVRAQMQSPPALRSDFGPTPPLE